MIMIMIGEIMNGRTIEDKIKVRFVQSGSMWLGEVYGHWKVDFLGVEINEYKGWNAVTSPCFTRLGAYFELKTWKRNHLGREFIL